MCEPKWAALMVFKTGFGGSIPLSALMSSKMVSVSGFYFICRFLQAQAHLVLEFCPKWEFVLVALNLICFPSLPMLFSYLSSTYRCVSWWYCKSFQRRVLLEIQAQARSKQTSHLSILANKTLENTKTCKPNLDNPQCRLGCCFDLSVKACS